MYMAMSRLPKETLQYTILSVGHSSIIVYYSYMYYCARMVRDKKYRRTVQFQYRKEITEDILS